MTTAALPLGFGGRSFDPAAPGWSGSGVDEPIFARAVETAGAASSADPRVGTVAGRETIATLLRPMTPLGQFRDTFIIAVDDEGLAIVDQHVAHERILFEQISERLTTRALESQRLLTPVVLDLSAGEHATLLSHRAALERFGFDIDDFGGGHLRVGAVPAILDWGRSEAALRAVAVRS